MQINMQPQQAMELLLQQRLGDVEPYRGHVGAAALIGQPANLLLEQDILLVDEWKE